MLSVVEALRLTRADSKSSILLSLDLSAALDKVNHQILLSTLLAKGISGTTIQWFESYLSDRSFKVSRGVQIATSSYRGAPGLSSWTSSLLCLHGITVIQKHGFPFHCYADDTQLYLSFHPDDPTITSCISACLTDISCWMKDHHLELNLAKTELLVVGANP